MKWPDHIHFGPICNKWATTMDKLRTLPGITGTLLTAKEIDGEPTEKSTGCQSPGVFAVF